MVYDQNEHAIVNKWLVLANPEEATPTVQGKQNVTRLSLLNCNSYGKFNTSVKLTITTIP